MNRNLRQGDGHRLETRVVSPLLLEKSELNKWNDLCSSVPVLSSPFLSATFSQTVALVRPHVYTAVIYRGGLPLAFFSFQFRTALHKSLGIAEPVGEYMSGYAGVVAAPGFSLSSSTLLRLCGLTYILVPFLEEGQLDYGLEASSCSQGCLVRLEGGSAAYWDGIKSRNKKFFAELMRRERQVMERYGPLEFCFQQRDWEAPLAHLMESKSRQYVNTRRPDLFSEPWRRQLIVRLAGAGDPACTGVLSTLYAGRTWVASHFGLRNGPVLNYYFPVYNPKLSRYSPGHLLLKAIIDTAGDQGVSLIDRGSGNTRAKQDFSNDTHRIFRAAWFRPGLRSLLYRAGCSLRWRFSGTVERFAHGLNDA
jgi:CelD/BcsL family acetyltransferase involved in cellulose biosynthesis